MAKIFLYILKLAKILGVCIFVTNFLKQNTLITNLYNYATSKSGQKSILEKNFT